MKKEKIINIISALLFIAFAVMFVVGMYSEEMAIVFRKASNICLQCIGLGG